MRVPRISLLAAAIASIGTATLAADFPPPLPAPVVPVEFGWYLRGDVGVGQLHANQLEYFPNAKNAGTDFAIEHSALGDTTFVGFGIGYTWNRWLRFDVTAEYRTKANLHAWGSYTAFCPVGVCLDVLDGFENSWVVLGNAYFDLGTWWCLTPFVGVGIGTAGNTITGFSDYGPQTGGRGIAPDHTNWNFAWAFHAGVAYTASPNLKLELAYRYLDMGSTWASINCVGGCAPDVFKLRDITSQDIMIGMRWLLQPEQPVLAPPLIRKG